MFRIAMAAAALAMLSGCGLTGGSKTAPNAADTEASQNAGVAQIFSAIKGSCRSRLGNCRWTHAWMRCRSAVDILSGVGLISSRGAGVGESEGAISGVTVTSGEAAGLGAGLDLRDGEGDANSQLSRLVVGEETLSRLVLVPPKAWSYLKIKSTMWVAGCLCRASFIRRSVSRRMAQSFSSRLAITKEPPQQFTLLRRTPWSGW